MTLVIGTSVNASNLATSVAPGEAVLQGQLSRCETQLSDWVNCASAKTPEGKAKIEEVSNQIALIKQRIAQSQETDPGRRADRAGISPDSAPKATAPLSGSASSGQAGANGLGGIVNAWA